MIQLGTRVSLLLVLVFGSGLQAAQCAHHDAPCPKACLEPLKPLFNLVSWPLIAIKPGTQCTVTASSRWRVDAGHVYLGCFWPFLGGAAKTPGRAVAATRGAIMIDKAFEDSSSQFNSGTSKLFINALKAAVSLCAFSTPRPSRLDDWSLRGATLAVRLRRLLGLVAKTPGRAATQTYLDCSSFKVTNGQLMPC